MVDISCSYGIHLDVCGFFGVVKGGFNSFLVVALLPNFAVQVHFFLRAEGETALDELDGLLKLDQWRGS